MTLAVDGLSFSYAKSAQARPALEDVTFDVAPGSTLAIVGPSGAGKSTLLRIVAGLLIPQRGEIRLGGATLRTTPARDRRIALVFQDDALFSTMSVRANLRFALRRGEPASRVEEIARGLHVDDHLDRMPRDLSGGERQRVALARALLSAPRALLLDEPLAHLDPPLRARVRDALRDARSRFEGPVVYVTHDHVEAMMLGDVLGTLVDGRLEDLGPPRRVYESPGNLRAAAALGSPAMNLFDDGGWTIGIRPEHVRLAADAPLRGRVERCEYAGDGSFVVVATERGPIVARVPSASTHAPGESIGVDLPVQHVRRFDRTSGAAVP